MHASVHTVFAHTTDVIHVDALTAAHTMHELTRAVTPTNLHVFAGRVGLSETRPGIEACAR